MAPITINGKTWDPDTDGGPTTAPDASNTNWIIIKSEKSLKKEQMMAVINQGAEIKQALGDNIYLCKYEPADLSSLRAMDFLHYVDVYHPFFVVESGLDQPDNTADSAGDDSAESSSIRVVISTQPGCDPSSLRETLIEQTLADQEDLEVHSNRVDATVTTSNVSQIAALEEVRIITQNLGSGPDLCMARDVVNLPCWVPSLQGNINSDRRMVMSGAGETINIVDSGFDEGVIPPKFDDFADDAALKALYPGPGVTLGVSDPFGHGTHVAGCAVANGTLSQIDGPLANQPGNIRGTAEGAGFTIVQVLESVSPPARPGYKVDSDLTCYIEQPYTYHGCRISNHSYGPPYDAAKPQSPYDATNEDVDRYIHSRPELLVTWSAGNNGRETSSAAPAQVNGRSCSKNTITVGASENARPVAADVFEPIIGKLADIDQVADYSSRGPSLEKRWKPDVCAPGTAILSARSRKTQYTTYPRYNGTDYCFKRGTSMAAPIVAGCCAVLRQTLKQRNFITPSGVLVKALLVNGAVDIERQAKSAPQIPNARQGFGRINVQASVKMILGVQNPPNTATALTGFIDAKGDTGAFKQLMPFTGEAINGLSIPAPYPIVPGGDTIPYTLKITLTWYDTPGPDLQCKLGLYVHAGGQYFYGNRGVIASGPDVDANYDGRNNVQQVLWENIPAGPITVGVRYYSAMDTNQKIPYALAWAIE